MELQLMYNNEVLITLKYNKNNNERMKYLANEEFDYYIKLINVINNLKNTQFTLIDENNIKYIILNKEIDLWEEIYILLPILISNKNISLIKEYVDSYILTLMIINGVIEENSDKINIDFLIFNKIKSDYSNSILMKEYLYIDNVEIKNYKYSIFENNIIEFEILDNVDILSSSIIQIQKNIKIIPIKYLHHVNNENDIYLRGEFSAEEYINSNF
jgi:hypothetical protein